MTGSVVYLASNRSNRRRAVLATLRRRRAGTLQRRASALRTANLLRSASEHAPNKYGE